MRSYLLQEMDLLLSEEPTTIYCGRLNFSYVQNIIADSKYSPFSKKNGLVIDQSAMGISCLFSINFWNKMLVLGLIFHFQKILAISI